MGNLLTVREASKEADVSIGYLHKLVKDGTIKGNKLGNQWALDRASFDAWLAKRRQKQQMERSM
jgi:excisionase family DNA binding protein